MPPKPTFTTTWPGPGTPASCSTTRRSSGAWITRQVQRRRIGKPAPVTSSMFAFMYGSSDFK
jgi:hypothetical protein